MDNQSNENKADLNKENDEQAELQWQQKLDDEKALKRGFQNKAEMDYYDNPDNQMVWVKLKHVDVSQHTKQKGKYSYVSWAWAWSYVKDCFPNLKFRYIDNKDGLNYFHDGRTAWVKVGVTINDIEYIEQLPVKDHRHNSIKIDQITSMDVNTTLKRCLTKALALHGLGINIFAGEDLPDEVADDQRNERNKVANAAIKKVSAMDFKLTAKR